MIVTFGSGSNKGNDNGNDSGKFSENYNSSGQDKGNDNDKDNCNLIESNLIYESCIGNDCCDDQNSARPLFILE